MRQTKLSVTNFLYKDDSFLFLKRSAERKVDPNKLNGVGGKLEPGENFLEASIRETYEETGYKVTPKDIKLLGVVRLHEGYEDDWTMCFFKIKVDTMTIPIGTTSDEGELIWIPKSEVMNHSNELVDDLNYCFEYIKSDTHQFFMDAKVNEEGKIVDHSISTIILQQ